MDDEPVLTELVNDPLKGATRVDWYCEPPPEGAAYDVVREEDGGWRRGYPVRRILEVRLTG